MIGWYVVVATKARDERMNDADSKAAILASWEVSVGGLDWIDELVAQGRVTKLRGGGYPNLYSAKAGDVLPMLNDGPPKESGGATIIGDDYVMPAGWRGNLQMYRDRMAACPPDHVLSIEAWDQS